MDDFSIFFDGGEDIIDDSPKLSVVKKAVGTCLDGLTQYVEEAKTHNELENYNEMVLSMAYCKKILISMDKITELLKESFSMNEEELKAFGLDSKVEEIMKDIEKLSITPEESIRLIKFDTEEKQKPGEKEPEERIGW